MLNQFLTKHSDWGIIFRNMHHHHRFWRRKNPNLRCPTLIYFSITVSELVPWLHKFSMGNVLSSLYTDIILSKHYDMQSHSELICYQMSFWLEVSQFNFGLNPILVTFFPNHEMYLKLPLCTFCTLFEIELTVQPTHVVCDSLATQPGHLTYAQFNHFSSTSGLL